MNTRSLPLRTHLALAALLLAGAAASPVPAAANGGWTGLRPYVRTNAPAATNRPPVGGGSGWGVVTNRVTVTNRTNITVVGGVRMTNVIAVTNISNEVTVPSGGTVCFGFLNSEDLTKRKYFRIEIDAMPASDIDRLDWLDAGGADSSGRPVKKKSTGWGRNVPRHGALYWEYTFEPQPAWEWICFKNNNGHEIKISVKAWSACALCRPSFNALSVQNCTFGAVGSGVMGVNQRIREVRVFPRTLPADPTVPPVFNAPLNTGPWRFQSETADPDGNPRTLGWRFISDGPGLAPNQPCQFSFQMQGPRADLQYVMYALDAATGQYQEYNLDLAAELRPDLSIRPNAGSVLLEFDSIAGIQYLIESTLDFRHWQPFTAIPGHGGRMTVPCPVTAPAQFFRVSAMPQ